MLEAIYPRKIMMHCCTLAEERDRLNFLAKSVTSTGTTIELFTNGILQFVEQKPYEKKNFVWEQPKSAYYVDDSGKRQPTGWVSLNPQVGHVKLATDVIQPEQLVAGLEAIAEVHCQKGEKAKPGAKPKGGANMQRAVYTVVKFILEAQYPENKYPSPPQRKTKITALPSSIPAELKTERTKRKVRPINEKRSGYWMGATLNAEERQYLMALGGSDWIREQLQAKMAADRR